MPGADVLETVAVHVAGLVVFLKRVQRAAFVGHLNAAVRTPDGTERPRSTRRRAFLDDEGMPLGEARRIRADEVPSPLYAQVVEREAAAVDEKRLPRDHPRLDDGLFVAVAHRPRGKRTDQRCHGYHEDDGHDEFRIAHLALLEMSDDPPIGASQWGSSRGNTRASGPRIAKAGDA